VHAIVELLKRVMTSSAATISDFISDLLLRLVISTGNIRLTLCESADNSLFRLDAASRRSLTATSVSRNMLDFRNVARSSISLVGILAGSAYRLELLLRADDRSRGTVSPRTRRIRRQHILGAGPVCYELVAAARLPCFAATAEAVVYS